MKFVKLLSFLVLVMLLSISDITAQITTDTLGNGTSSSATRGPFQRSDTGSSSVYSNANLVYTQGELATTLGIPTGASITQINWDLGSTNVITATGTATLKVYMKNSSVANATGDLWANLIAGQTLVGTYTFDATNNNFPGAKGLMDFALDVPFVYTGNSIEVAVEWDCSGLTTTSNPVNANKLFSGNGSLNWRWDDTAHGSSVYRSGSSSAPSDLTNQTVKTQRVNTQFVYTTGSSSSDSVNITMEINTANIVANGGTVSADGIYLAGGAGFGLPGDNPATDLGNGIWSVTVKRAKGFSSFYTFLNGNCPGWNCKEDLTGLPCGDPANFNDRLLPGVYSDTTVLACFGSCESDGTCTAPNTPNDITFNINMDSAPDSIKNTFTTVYVAGDFNGWSGDANPLTDNGDGTWSATIAIPAATDTIEYKFEVDNWAPGGDEVFTSGDPCTITDPSGQFVNRVLAVTGDETLPVYCWSTCIECLSGTNGLQVDNNLFSIRPNVTTSYTNIHFADNAVMEEKVISVYNALGELVMTEVVNNTNIYNMNVNNFAAGMYFVNVQSENRTATKRLVIQN